MLANDIRNAKLISTKIEETNASYLLQQLIQLANELPDDVDELVEVR